MIREVTTTCPICGISDNLYVNGVGYSDWQSGSLIQNALPELNASQREQLMTGICAPCWDRSFGEDE